MSTDKKRRIISSTGKIAIQIIVGIIIAVAGGFSGAILLRLYEANTSGESQIRQTINSEAEFVLDGHTEKVVSLFAENAFIRDAAGGDINNEKVWEGKQRILSRYEALPRFNYLKHDAMEISISQDKKYARVIADTVGSYILNGNTLNITSNRGEKWTLEVVKGEWIITSFTYNLP